MASGFKLKWLNGPFMGRELVLPEGELRIGGPDGDILLPLESMTGAVLSTSEEGVRLSFEGAVWIDGTVVGVVDCLPLGQTIDLAGVAFILGYEDSNINYLCVPERIFSEDKQPGGRLNHFLVAMSVFVLIAIGLMVWQPTKEETVFDPQTWLQAEISKPALQGLRVKQGLRGEWVLSGSCKHSSDISALRDTLREWRMHFRDESVCADILRESVRKVLALNGYHDVEVSSGTADTVDVYGAIRADGNWLRTAEQLRNIPGLRDWSVRNDQAQLFEQLLAALAEYDLLEGLSLAVSNRAFLLSGELSSDESIALASVIEAFNEARPRLKAQYQNIPSAPPVTQVLPAMIVTVGGDRSSIYLELANGMRLQQGSVLPSGYRVYALSRKAIALVKDQQLLSLPIDL
ncbi:type III secretion system inner membrane ring subunit SctD [Pseudomonas sp. IPO3774]|uniref:type III secretion system inner membrane ring subunit SctD n=1 Tax=Pseudomonas sp. IPO3774 TaxID=2738826 RepID=UPI0015A1B9E6|nr:type III secretion system inner membrane ring subunit SctD [Pseudomonas sp. IPO3774]NWD64125.1 type III secretion system inner membrane ring subunit SctD [Pseudomonas sp. IPO3774]